MKKGRTSPETGKEGVGGEKKGENNKGRLQK